MSERFAISQKAFLRGGPHLTRRRVLAGGGGFVTATLFGSNIYAAVPAANELTLNANVARWSSWAAPGPPLMFGVMAIAFPDRNCALLMELSSRPNGRF
jgi:hypothetical protein